MWLIVFVLALPLAIYKALREPIWAAVIAAYFYFAIPTREFLAPSAPYQVIFWAVAALTSWRYRSFGQQWARQELDTVGLEIGREVVAALEPELRRQLHAVANERATPSEAHIQKRVADAVTDRAFDLVGERAPEVLVAPITAAIGGAIEAAAAAGGRELLAIRAIGEAQQPGALHAALEARAAPAMKAAFETTATQAIADVIQRLLEEDERISGRGRQADRGPLNFPLERGPAAALASNSGIWLHLAFIALNYFGALNARHDYTVAIARFEQTLLLLIPLVAIVCAVRTIRHWRLFMWGWMFGVWHLSMNGINIWLRYGGRADQIGGQGNDANFLGAITVFVAPVAFSMAIAETRTILRWIGLFAAGCYTLAIIACGSRGALLAFAASMGYWLLCSKRKLLAIGLALVGLACFLAVAPQEFWERMGTMVLPGDTNPWIHHTLEPSAHERVLLWDLAIDLFKQNPWFGIGPQQFVKESEVLPIVDAYFGQRGMMTHNSWLQIAAEYGGVGLVVWAGNFVLPLLFYRRARSKLAGHPELAWFPPYCIGLEAGVIGSAAAITFSSFQWLDYVYWGMILGPLTLQVAADTALRLSWYNQASAPAAPPPPPRYRPRQGSILEAVIGGGRPPPEPTIDEADDEVWGEGEDLPEVTHIARVQEEVTHFVPDPAAPLEVPPKREAKTGRRRKKPAVGEELTRIQLNQIEGAQVEAVEVEEAEAIIPIPLVRKRHIHDPALSKPTLDLDQVGDADGVGDLRPDEETQFASRPEVTVRHQPESTVRLKLPTVTRPPKGKR